MMSTFQFQWPPNVVFDRPSTAPKIRIPWGVFGPHGAWQPNQLVTPFVSEEEQYRQNVAAGYLPTPDPWSR